MAEITGIDVHPSDESNVLPVAVKQIGAFYYPVYLSATGDDGEITSGDNPQPVRLAVEDGNLIGVADIVGAQESILKELKIMNKHLSKITGTLITREDID